MTKSCTKNAKVTFNGYDALANAIVIQAVSDYRSARRKLRKEPGCHLAKRDINDCEEFFTGQWIKALTEIDGNLILKRLEEEFIQ